MKHRLFYSFYLLVFIFSAVFAKDFDYKEFIEAWADEFIYVVDKTFDYLSMTQRLGFFLEQDIHNNIAVDYTQQDVDETVVSDSNTSPMDDILYEPMSLSTALSYFSKKQEMDDIYEGKKTYLQPDSDDATQEELEARADPFISHPMFVAPFWLRAILYPAVDPKPVSSRLAYYTGPLRGVDVHLVADPEENLKCFLHYLQKNSEENDAEPIDKSKWANGSSCKSSKYLGTADEDWKRMDAAHRFSKEEISSVVQSINQGIWVDEKIFDTSSSLKSLFEFYMMIEYNMSLLGVCENYLRYAEDQGDYAIVEESTTGPGAMCLQDSIYIYNQAIQNVLNHFNSKIPNVDSGLGKDDNKIILGSKNIIIEPILEGAKISLSGTSTTLTWTKQLDYYILLQSILKRMKQQLLEGFTTYLIPNMVHSVSDSVDTSTLLEAPMVSMNLLLSQEHFFDVDPKKGILPNECIYPDNPLLELESSPTFLSDLWVVDRSKVTPTQKINKAIKLMDMLAGNHKPTSFIPSTSLPLTLSSDGVATINYAVDSNSPVWNSDEGNSNTMFDRFLLLGGVRNIGFEVLKPEDHFLVQSTNLLDNTYGAIYRRGLAVSSLNNKDDYNCSLMMLSNQLARWRFRPVINSEIEDQFSNWSSVISDAKPVSVMRHIAVILSEILRHFSSFSDLIEDSHSSQWMADVLKYKEDMDNIMKSRMTKATKIFEYDRGYSSQASS